MVLSYIFNISINAVDMLLLNPKVSELRPSPLSTSQEMGLKFKSLRFKVSCLFLNRVLLPFFIYAFTHSRIHAFTHSCILLWQHCNILALKNSLIHKLNPKVSELRPSPPSTSPLSTSQEKGSGFKVWQFLKLKAETIRFKTCNFKSFPHSCIHAMRHSPLQQ